MTTRLAYSLAEAAQASSLSVRSLRYLIQTGRLGYAKVGRRVLIPYRREVVTAVDVAARLVSVEPPEGLLE